MSLVELIGADLQLTKRGKDWWGFCPFHAEKTPSFSVVADKEFYHCFGCGAHGDAIDWLRKQRGMSYPEACRQIGKDLPPDPQRERRRQIKAQLEWDYWTWRRKQWRELLDREAELRIDIALAEAAYRSLVRAPDLWTEAEWDVWSARLACLYGKRDLINNDLDLLQSYRDEHTVQRWWRETR